MGFFDKKEQKTMKTIKKDVYCCECHRKQYEVYIRPENEEGFLDTYHMCNKCFVELVEKLRDAKKGEH